MTEEEKKRCEAEFARLSAVLNTPEAQRAADDRSRVALEPERREHHDFLVRSWEHAHKRQVR
jgi:hypothetical protein